MRVLRESADLSQVELAKATGISQNYISSLELGKIASPSMELLCILGHRFGLAPNDIAALADWWVPKRAVTLPDGLEWSIGVFQELPKSDRAMLATVLRQMVTASYLESHGHAPPPPLAGT